MFLDPQYLNKYKIQCDKILWGSGLIRSGLTAIRRIRPGTRWSPGALSKGSGIALQILELRLYKNKVAFVPLYITVKIKNLSTHKMGI